MYSSEYVPTFENDEQERIQNIKDHLAKNELDYLYHEFDFEDNEDIVDAYFDDEDQLHIIYNTTEPEDLEDQEQIECPDGITRSQEEYNMWISSLMSLYEIEPTDLTKEEIQALIEGGYIDGEDDDFYTEDAKEVLEEIQEQLSDEERLDYWNKFESSQDSNNSVEDKNIEDFWNWLESLDSDTIEDFGSFISSEKLVDEEDIEKPWDCEKHF